MVPGELTRHHPEVPFGALEHIIATHVCESSARPPRLLDEPVCVGLMPARGGLSFLIWIAEVDDVLDCADRIATVRLERSLAVLLRDELEHARHRAQSRQIARKAFRFEPSDEVLALAGEAIDTSRRGPRIDPAG